MVAPREQRMAAPRAGKWAEHWANWLDANLAVHSAESSVARRAELKAVLKAETKAVLTAE